MEREQEKRDLNRKQIAAMCQMSSPYYLRILDGTANPTTQLIARIANGLNVSLEALLLRKERGSMTGNRRHRMPDSADKTL